MDGSGKAEVEAESDLWSWKAEMWQMGCDSRFSPEIEMMVEAIFRVLRKRDGN